MNDSVLKDYFSKISGNVRMEFVWIAHQWLSNLTDKVNERVSRMKPDDKGIELDFRFRKAYGKTHQTIIL